MIESSVKFPHKSFTGAEIHLEWWLNLVQSLLLIMLIAHVCQCIRWGCAAKKRKKGGNWDMQARINLTYQLHGMPKPSIRLTSFCTAPYYTLVQGAQLCTSIRETDNTDIWEAGPRWPTAPPQCCHHQKTQAGLTQLQNPVPPPPTSLSTQSTKRHKSTVSWQKRTNLENLWELGLKLLVEQIEVG